MRDINENRKTSDDLDRILDAGLAKYASADPRAGLEERILANLRTADTSTLAKGWWNWRMATVLAVVLVIAASVAWRWNKVSAPPIVVHRPEIKETPMAPRVASRETNPAPQTRGVRQRVLRDRVQPGIVAAVPKLDVFPSPLPLTEQEKILASYIAKDPEHAALVAEARMDALRQEDEERRRMTAELDSKE